MIALALSASYAAGAESPRWSFARNGTHGTILATMHLQAAPDEEARVVALQHRLWLRSVVRPNSVVHLEREPAPPDFQIDWGKRTAPLEPGIAQQVESRLKGTVGWRVNTLLVQPDWVIAIALNVARQRRIANKAPLAGTETELMRIVAESGLAYQGLEPHISVYQEFASLPAGAQRKLLQDALLEDASYEAGIRRLSMAFRQGSHEELCALIDEQKRARPDYWEAIVAKRNRAWLDTIERLPSKLHHVVAVGAAHTCGDDSLLALMQRAGFSVHASEKAQ